jgi:hypothetical protein
MTAFPRIFAAALAAASAITPAAAQYPYQYPYPQGQYPQNYPYGYPGQPGGIGGAIIDQLLGRYQVNDRTAIRQCANAAVNQAQNQYRGYGQYGAPGVPYGYDQQNVQPYGYGYNIRVTAITDVERRSDGLRVRGLLDSGRLGYNQNIYNQNYAANSDLSFRCTVDWRGYVSSIRVGPNQNWRRY